MPILDHFGLLAPLYETFIHPRDPVQLRALLAPPIDGPLLDAGGGTGRVAQFLRDVASEIVVTDLSFKMLQQTAAKDSLHSACAHAEALPFPDGSFARVIMVDALHHVCHQAKTAAELWRVLRPGGRLIIEEPDLRLRGVKLLALAEKLALMRSHFLSPPQIAGLFTTPDAHIHIEVAAPNAWIIMDKLSQRI
ncbi:MAG TPA: class I SAM-dependent methyltransferase [Anaerolineae bacterium]|nr:class I SAM-dependent methyltransferase [Anaerolineae bacterium]